MILNRSFSSRLRDWASPSKRRKAAVAHVEAMCLVVLGVLASALSLAALSISAVVFAARMPAAAGFFVWCERLADTVPWWIGAPSLALLVGGLIGGVRVCRQHLRSRASKGAPGVVVIDTSELFAYSIGGRHGHGQVIVSKGMLDELTPPEREVVFAHEAAHLDLRHHRLLWVVDLVALNPLMRPLRRRIRFALERCADEEAVRRIGDRAMVARTISRVALLAVDSGPSTALRVDGSGVPARVEALLTPGAVVRPYGPISAALGVIGAASVLGWSQWPHLALLMRHLCSL